MTAYSDEIRIFIVSLVFMGWLWAGLALGHFAAHPVLWTLADVTALIATVGVMVKSHRGGSE